MTGTPKDHYVPQFYLDAFAIEGPGVTEPHVYQYMSEKVVSPRISDVASEKHFYTVREKDTGKPLRDLDEIFTMIEGKSAAPLKRIINEESVEIDEEGRAVLAIFFAFLAVRTPGFINAQKSMAGAALKEFMSLQAEHKEGFEKSTAEAGLNLDPDQSEELRQYILAKDYGVDFGNKSYFLGQGLEVGKEIADWYCHHKAWHLLVSDSDKIFVTSDNPISIYQPSFGNPLLHRGYKHGTLFIPISPKHGLLLRDVRHKSSVLRATESRVLKLNEGTMRFSDNYIFSNLGSKSIAEKYRSVGNKHYQEVQVKRHKWAPYTFFGHAPIPPEPQFKSSHGIKHRAVIG